MQPATSQRDQNVLYEPDERPPHAITFLVGFQNAGVAIASIVLMPAIVARAAGIGEPYLSWSVFAALIVCGLATMLQAARIGRIGAGHILMMGASGAFVAVCVTALVEGGPAMLATLVVVSSLAQFALSAHLSLLRRIITPTVVGTVIMLSPVTVMPIVFDTLTDVPAGTPTLAAPASAAVTLVVMVMLVLRVSGVWRLWVPVMGIVAGCIVASFFGLYDIGRVGAAAWVGVPTSGWPGFDLGFGPVFWSLLPAFVFMNLVIAIRTIGDAIAIQKVSWRRPRAPDFQVVQGAVAANGMGSLLSGLVSTVPSAVYSLSTSITELTGVAARGVGACIGIVFLAVAFLPKLSALLLAVPNPVAAAYLLVLMALLFMLGVEIIVQDGVDYRKATVAGVSFWVGVGFQHQLIFAEYIGERWLTLLSNGITSGGLTAVLLTLFIGLTAPRSRRIETALAVADLPKIRAFLEAFAARRGWNVAMADRLCLAAEETLQILIQQGEDEATAKERRLLLVARSDGASAANLEFVAATGEGNIEDHIAILGERDVNTPLEHEISLRLLRQFTSSVRHQQYHDSDIVTIRIDVPPRERETTA